MRTIADDCASRASMTMIIIILAVATLAGAQPARAQPGSPPAGVRSGSPRIESGVSRNAQCNATVLRCDAGFPSAAAWSDSDAFGSRGLGSPQSADGSRSYWLIGAIGGFVVGATATYFVLHSGGSTSKCDRDANQDALNRGECAGLVALGGLVGAGAGALIGSRFRYDAVRLGPMRGLEIGRSPTGRMSIATAWVH